MNRETIINEAMYAKPTPKEGLVLQPFTLAIGQVLEEKKNRFASGASFKPKMAELNELMFVMTHDIDTILAIPDDEWRKEVIRFASTLSSEQIEAIQEHTEAEIEKTQATEVKPRGNGKAAKAG